MYLEYLFLKDDFEDEIETYVYEYQVKNKNSVTRVLNSNISTTKLSDSESCVVIIEILNSINPEEEAKHLSNIDAEFSKKYKSILLRNDASAYYNQKLYPLVNEFERQLRRFLYIKNALHTGDKVKKNIENLESKDLGEIYQLLFVDEDFCKNIRSKINNPGIFSKNELFKEIDKCSEITTWDKIVGINDLSIIKENFLNIKEYRNGVMHAKNITYEEFKLHKTLFDKTTMELSDAINSLIQYPVNKEHAEFAVESLYEGMKTVISGVQEALNVLGAQLAVSNLRQYLSSNEFEKTDSNIKTEQNL